VDTDEEVVHFTRRLVHFPPIFYRDFRPQQLASGT